MNHNHTHDQRTSEIRDRIRNLVCSIISEDSSHEYLKDDHRLTDYGLTSLDMAKLIIKLESEFGVELSDSDVIIANFETVDRITKLILSRTQGTFD
ncbi:acyl carrier protein [Inquilinus limosus]|uniref:acyl carrier protein n=1 Tax=Inquilinus limosus TaxID=171674 RepID=UPI003F1899FD